MRKIAIIVGAVAAFMLASCSNPNPPAAFLAHNLGSRRGDFTYSVNLGSDPKDVYFQLTNTQDTQQIGITTINSEASAASNASTAAIPDALAKRLDSFKASMAADGRKPLLKDAFGLPRPDLPLERYRDAARAAEQAKAAGVEPRGVAPMNDDAFGDPGLFCFDIPYVSSASARCQLVTTATFPDGKQRKLSIWVDADEWTGNGGPITQTMVDALGQRFFGTPAGSGDSIYSWVTNILGAEWGNVSYTDLIPFDSCITIMLCDIEENNSDNGGIVGYFYPKHNFTNAAALDYYGQVSNQRVMFYIDSVMYANASNDGSDGDTNWAVTDYWPEEVFSTLAHEFQHMIAFYQINVRGGTDNDTWFTELCSMTIEDLLADKIGVPGPRGVAYDDYTAGTVSNEEGRIPWFNYSTGVGLIDGWEYSDWTYYAYGQSYAFGAYLARNYGGANFLKNVFEGSGSVVERVEAVTGQSFKDLLAYWSMAVLLSDRTDTPTRLAMNRNGSFDSVVGGVTYRLGSINHFNYLADTLIGPYCLTPSELEEVDWYHGYGSWFCNAGQGLTQEEEFKVSVGQSNGIGVGFVAK